MSPGRRGHVPPGPAQGVGEVEHRTADTSRDGRRPSPATEPDSRRGPGSMDCGRALACARVVGGGGRRTGPRRGGSTAPDTRGGGSIGAAQQPAPSSRLGTGAGHRRSRSRWSRIATARGWPSIRRCASNAWARRARMSPSAPASGSPPEGTLRLVWSQTARRRRHRGRRVDACSRPAAPEGIRSRHRHRAEPNRPDRREDERPRSARHGRPDDRVGGPQVSLPRPGPPGAQDQPGRLVAHRAAARDQTGRWSASAGWPQTT